VTTQDILFGDALSVMPLDYVEECDVMLTDPEYSAHTHKSAVSASAVRGVRKRDFGFESMTPLSRGWLGAAAARVRRWSVIYSDVEESHRLREACVESGAEYVRTVPWVRWSMPQLSGDRPSQGFEHLLLLHAPGKKRWNGPGNLVSLEHKALRGEEKHKAEKPLDQALDLVAWFSDPGECVFDPRAGAGTIGLACRLLGRNYVGVERQKEWVDRATARLAAPLSERDAERLGRWAAATLARREQLGEADRMHGHDLELALRIGKAA
jgi:site-specific DNA-methyltransferase (adenine-specific)